MRHGIGLMRVLLGVIALGATVAVSQAASGAQAAAAPAAVPPQIEDRERLERALTTLKPQRPGVVDAYVVVAALDTDAVFGREAREAARVLAARFDAEGRTIVLAEDEGSETAHAAGTPGHLARALGRVAALMDRKEDALVLYVTTHGTQRAGLNYKDAVRGTGVIAPAELAGMLAQQGFENRLIILQACYSGQFIPALATPRTVVVTAASAWRPSFGCSPGNDWTFFGHALINHAMRRPDTFVRQFRRAFVLIDGWERQLGIPSSNPQISMGSDAAAWLAALDARVPKSGNAPVGRPPAELTE